MSVSALLQIEACPRQWTLRHGSYPEIWEGRGYPPRPQMRAIEGRVVHDTMRTIVGALVDSGCTSIDSEQAVVVLRTLGGLSKVLAGHLQTALAEFDRNPRVRDLGDLGRRAAASIPALRTTVQLLLRGARLSSGSSRQGAEERSDRHSGVRRALGPGVHREVAIEVPSIGWRGTLDLIEVSDDGCAIVEYKSGEASDEHRFQLRAYAVLWREAADFNPQRNAATSLTLVYPSEVVKLDVPSHADLDSTLREMQVRSERARELVAASPPEARPSVDKCSYCDVRHLCGAYWATNSRPLANGFADLEARLTERRSSTAWTAVTVLKGESAEILLSFASAAVMPPALKPGVTVRLLDVRVNTEVHEGSINVIVAVGTYSETFVSGSE